MSLYLLFLGPILPHISENNNNVPVNNLFDLPIDDTTFSLNNKSSDDDGNRPLVGELLIKTIFLLLYFTFYNKLNRFIFQIESFKNYIYFYTY